MYCSEAHYLGRKICGFGGPISTSPREFSFEEKEAGQSMYMCVHLCVCYTTALRVGSQLACSKE